MWGDGPDISAPALPSTIFTYMLNYNLLSINMRRHDICICWLNNARANGRPRFEASWGGTRGTLRVVEMQIIEGKPILVELQLD